jgi:hypothetical protein
MEHFLRSDFVQYEAGEPSTLIPGRVQTGREIFFCPSCGDKAEPPQHAVQGYCKCGLHWISYGNSLQLWNPSPI